MMPTIDETIGTGGAMMPGPVRLSVAETGVRVWDPLVRLFHWSLVAAFLLAWITGDEAQRIHEVAGYTIVALIVTRIAWGLIGTAHARFSDFVHRPSTTFRHLADAARFRSKRYLGHNPAGGAMVVALLTMLSLVCASGFAMTTDAFSGVEWIEETHEIAVNLTLLLIGVHLIGVGAASLEHRENLIGAMITGRKRRE